jgi:TPR repeat protein
MYGMGVAQNYEEAHSYFSKAAEAGNSEGRFNLGRSAPHAVLSCADCVAFRELCHTS